MMRIIGEIDRMVKKMDGFYLMDLERTLLSYVPCFWTQNRFGYTYKIERAGIFSRELAEEIVKHDLDDKTVMISEKLVHQIRLMEAHEE